MQETIWRTWRPVISNKRVAWIRWSWRYFPSFAYETDNVRGPHHNDPDTMNFSIRRACNFHGFRACLAFISRHFRQDCSNRVVSAKLTNDKPTCNKPSIKLLIIRARNRILMWNLILGLMPVDHESLDY